MLGRRPDAFEAGLADLVAACESGVDLAGVLEAARRAASAAAGGAEAAAYAIADDGTNLRLVGGPGVDELAIPAEPEPQHVDGAWVVPLISARRTVGCLLVRAPAGARIARVRLVAGIAAQAVEVARLWEAVAGGASHDPLTGLPGHRSFDRVLARELSRAMRTGDSVAVGVVAVDGMTERNEADGLPAGDELLRTAAECFGGGVRPYDTVCRLGGNDFAPGAARDGGRAGARPHRTAGRRLRGVDRRSDRLGRSRGVPGERRHPGRADAARDGRPLLGQARRRRARRRLRRRRRRGALGRGACPPARARHLRADAARP